MSHLLHVEDDPTVQRAFARMLRGHMVTSVATVADAITAMTNITFDAVVTDYNLAGAQTGEELLLWVAANQPAMLEKIIVFSASEDAREIHSRVIPKPDMRALRVALELGVLVS
jgi:CheY-like chemotaxis protein